MIISRRPVPLPLLLTISRVLQAQSNPNAPSDLTAATVGGSISREWEAPTQYPAFTCRWGVGAAANAGIQYATGTARSMSAEFQDDGKSIEAPAPFTDNRDDPEALARATVAYLLGPRQAPPDPQVEAGARDQRGLAAARSRRLDAGITAPTSNPGKSAEAAKQRTAPASQSGHCQRARKPAAEPGTSIRTGAGRSSREIDASHGQTQADSSRDPETPTRDTP